jgi:translation initiation factor IF-2
MAKKYFMGIPVDEVIVTEEHVLIQNGIDPASVKAESIPEPVPEPVKEVVVEPVPEPVKELVVEPVPEPVPEPVVESEPSPDVLSASSDSATEESEVSEMVSDAALPEAGSAVEMAESGAVDSKPSKKKKKKK